MVPSKGGSSPSDARSCVSSVRDAYGNGIKGDVDHEYLAMDQSVPFPDGGYYGYYYPGYGGFFEEPDNQGYYVGADAVDLQYPVHLFFKLPLALEHHVLGQVLPMPQRRFRYFPCYHSFNKVKCLLSSLTMRKILIFFKC
ncbi:uncharacterized protein [Arachis hypogaea]|nr:uncharacterized protein LOC112702389 isoform X2 [Arachis hypogaea]QHO27314.1 uncharacterized protein DS421_7g206960 [Arachis hypogaea]